MRGFVKFSKRLSQQVVPPTKNQNNGGPITLGEDIPTDHSCLSQVIASGP